jgi:hypothetical protein
MEISLVGRTLSGVSARVVVISLSIRLGAMRSDAPPHLGRGRMERWFKE